MFLKSETEVNIFDALGMRWAYFNLFGTSRNFIFIANLSVGQQKLR